MKTNKQNKGQIAIIVLLASAIILTLGLSASKTAITDTKVDTDEELLKEAFNTAESAINNYLTDSNKTNYTTEGSGANIVATQIGGNNIKEISSEGVVSANTNQLFWLVNHNENGDIGSTYYGGSSSYFKIEADNSNVALKIDYFYIDGSDYKVDRFGCYTGTDLTNFVGFTFNCNNNISTSGKNSLLVSVTPLGGSSKIKISGDSEFPVQGEEIMSTSITDSGVKTQIKTRYVYQFPSFMLDAITARGGVE
ncbi:MAG: hypothetical protein PHP97_03620, partial [Candidatus Shapirobacteria bacterium]|nr:hypothetical protein [Candidatus Shapirobacteria bacterium]MDD3002570.1 hypothetical protein [Candidatus Shapirobacteria bacterium]MDD4383061.1 hypothetical protein [Candidatus Shapirobacteria bacterium]